MSSHGKPFTKSWSLRMSDPLMHEPIISLAGACKRRCRRTRSAWSAAPTAALAVADRLRSEYGGLGSASAMRLR